jgi:hypothetical protein
MRDVITPWAEEENAQLRYQMEQREAARVREVVRRVRANNAESVRPCQICGYQDCAVGEQTSHCLEVSRERLRSYAESCLTVEMENHRPAGVVTDCSVKLVPSGGLLLSVTATGAAAYQGSAPYPAGHLHGDLRDYYRQTGDPLGNIRRAVEAFARGCYLAHGATPAVGEPESCRAPVQVQAPRVVAEHEGYRWLEEAKNRWTLQGPQGTAITEVMRSTSGSNGWASRWPNGRTAHGYPCAWHAAMWGIRRRMASSEVDIIVGIAKALGRAVDPLQREWEGLA